MYLDVEGSIKPVDDLNLVCHRIPVDLVLGKKPDFMCVPWEFSLNFQRD